MTRTPLELSLGVRDFGEKTMKKFVIILAALCLVLSFAACGKKNEDKKSTPVSLSPLGENGGEDDGIIYTPEDVLVPTETAPEAESKAPAGEAPEKAPSEGQKPEPGKENNPAPQGGNSGSDSGKTDPSTPSTPSNPSSPSTSTDPEKESDPGVTTPEMAME